jgi:hypothetical protein
MDSFSMYSVLSISNDVIDGTICDLNTIKIWTKANSSDV